MVARVNAQPVISRNARLARRSAASVLLVAVLLVGLLALLSAGQFAPAALAQATWTTYHHDAARSGTDPEPTRSVTPTLTWQSPGLGAPIWGQPLVLGSRVYVATVGNEIYALDASTGSVIWEQSAGMPVPSEQVTCGDIEPTVGIVGTPVIDVATNAIYAVADVWNAATKEAHHELVGYELTTGNKVLSTPVDPPGANPKTLLERPALNLDQGNVVFGFGGNAGDCGQYRGAIASAPENGGPATFWNYQPAAPAYGGAAVWGTSGPAVDAAGHIYVSTGNPNFPKGQEVSTYDLSDSLLELNPSLEVIGNFAPESWLSDSNKDRDLGSAGPLLLPGGLVFEAGKNEMGYLIEASAMPSHAPALFGQKVCKGKVEGEGEGSFGGDAYSAETIYVPCTDGVRALSYNQAGRSFAALWHGPADATGPPIVSGGLVWVISGKFLAGGGTKLYGLDPATGVPRYTETLPSPVIDHFASPSAGEGHVFVATGSSVTSFHTAVLDEPPTVVSQQPSSVTRSSATLNATVNANESAIGECRFEYGTTVSYGSSVACSAVPGAGQGTTAVSAALTGLSANVTYHFRIVATNPGGTSYGSDETLETLPNPPVVLTGSASTVTQTAAMLNATVDPGGAAVADCHFDYGTTSAFGSTAPCTAPAGEGAGPVAVAAPITALTPDTNYFFRIVASNGGGISYGATQSVATLVPTPPSSTPQTTPEAAPLSSTPLAATPPASHGVLAFQEQQPATPVATLVSTSLTASRSGIAYLEVRCPAGHGRCVGTVALRTVNAVAARVPSRPRAKILTLAVAPFNLAGGREARVKVRLSGAARGLLRRARVLRVHALITTKSSGATRTTQTLLTLRD